jgi:aldose 1-epimerase
MEGMGEQRCTQYGTLPDGRAVLLYRLQNKAGTYVEIMNYGGIIRSLVFPDKNGKSGDIVMGYETFEDQLNNRGWSNAIIGRCVNRISGGELPIHGKIHKLEKNVGNLTLHGGPGGYGQKLFASRFWEDAEGEKLTLYHRDLGEGGFPGEVDFWVTYVLTGANELKIKYKALPTEDTVLNFSSHCYFNLGGHDSGSVADHEMRINADYYLPDNEEGLPTGEIRKTAGTVFDFNKGRKLREGRESGDEQIRLQRGYDHNFCLAGTGFRQVARVREEKSGRCMTVFTDLPGVQLYTACNEPEGKTFKAGAEYHKYDAFCLETQYYPDAVHHSHFLSPLFPGDKVFYSETVFSLSIE